ncbi:MAG: TetR/AcrR family transcriptional regulator [Jatrophihabitans sp.]|uniref:TetR/AcrR family transcriptional regulator n=1 Tax=Jatrophihabitans sp. TaxID=1932789 RepID=UPI003912571A
MTVTASGPDASAPAQRKRGVALEDAIREAAFAELTEVGYTAFSVEGVAARARTGKASIYRRWPTKQELVTDVLCEMLPSPDQAGITVDLDDSVTTHQALLGVARAIAGVITSPSGAAMRAIKCEAMGDPELARLVDERFQAPRRAALLSLLRRGVQRGEVRPEAATQLVADVIPAVLSHRVILQREPLTQRDIIDIIEQIFIPLVEVR